MQILIAKRFIACSVHDQASCHKCHNMATTRGAMFRDACELKPAFANWGLPRCHALIWNWRSSGLKLTEQQHYMCFLPLTFAHQLSASHHLMRFPTGSLQGLHESLGFMLTRFLIALQQHTVNILFDGRSERWRSLLKLIWRRLVCTILVFCQWQTVTALSWQNVQKI